MAALRALASDLDLGNPRTLLQSGNLVFDARGRPGDLERRLEREAAARLGLHTEFLVRSAKAWGLVVSGNPFPGMAANDPGHLLVMFLKGAASAGAVEALRAGITGRETMALDGRELYICYPDGVGRSRMTGTLIERALGTRGTARNWNTVLKVAALL
jgi:uncharacterized protein (DUF1697 family)